MPEIPTVLDVVEDTDTDGKSESQRLLLMRTVSLFASRRVERVARAHRQFLIFGHAGATGRQHQLFGEVSRAARVADPLALSGRCDPNYGCAPEDTRRPHQPVRSKAPLQNASRCGRAHRKAADRVAAWKQKSLP